MGELAPDVLHELILHQREDLGHVDVVHVLQIPGGVAQHLIDECRVLRLLGKDASMILGS